MNAARKQVRVRGRRAPTKSSRKNSSAAAPRGSVPAPSATSLGPYATVGKDLGSLLGFAPLGERLGGAIGRLFGKGDYQVMGNSLMESYGRPAAGPPTPALFKAGKRGVRVVEREYLGDIRSGALSSGSSVFTNQAFRLNPADPTTFPWLSRLARRFEQWEPNGIVFEFRSTSSEFNGSSQALGTVILSTDYDPVDAPYTSKVEAENSDYAMSVKSSDCAIHGIECAPSERPTPVLYTLIGERPANTDPRMYDLGTFQICTQGMSTANVVLGELWVTYDITFYKKQIATGDGPDYTGRISFSYSPAGSTSDYFGVANAGARFWGNWNNASFITSDRIYLPPTAEVDTVFAVEIAYTASTGTVVAPTLTASGATAVSGDTLLIGASAGNGDLTISSVGSVAYVRRFYKVTGPNAYITASSGTLGSITAAYTLVHECAPAIPYSGQPAS